MLSIFILLIVNAIINIIIYGACIIAGSFVIWMLVDAAKQDRFWWVVLILGVPFVGAAVYYLTEKKHEYAKAPSHHIHQSETEAQHETSHVHHNRHKKEHSVEETLLEEEKKELYKIEEEKNETVDLEQQEQKEVKK